MSNLNSVSPSLKLDPGSILEEIHSTLAFSSDKIFNSDFGLIKPWEEILALTVWGFSIIVLTKGISCTISFASAVGLFLIRITAIITDAAKNIGPRYFLKFTN